MKPLSEVAPLLLVIQITTFKYFELVQKTFELSYGLGSVIRHENVDMPKNIELRLSTL